MHAFYALSTLFLQAFLTIPTTVLLPSDLRNDTSLLLPNATNPTSTALTSSEPILSQISLAFNLFGSQISSSAVNAAFVGAVTRIYPYLHDQPDDPITNDGFHYRAVGGDVYIGVIAILSHGVSWQQLHAVLRQAFRFMNGDLGDHRPHMQELSFEIIMVGTKIGEGFVIYHPSHGFQSRESTPVNPENANDTTLLLAPTDPSLNTSTANAIHFKIPNTPFKLIIGFLGDAIPGSNVFAVFEGAHLRIIGPLGHFPTHPIPGERFEYNEADVRITVLAKPGVLMTWKQLSWVLGGMYGFMAGPPEHNQLLTCEISFPSHGMVGYASVWYYPPSLQVTKRDNTTAKLPLVPDTPGDVPFPVPNTPIILTFNFFGRPIPQRELDDTIAAALDQIGPSYRDRGLDPVPGNNFFQGRNRVRIAIYANVPHVMSWIEIHSIMWGLSLFVTGSDRGKDYHRALNFDVNDDTLGVKLSYGTVRYATPRMVSF